VNFLRKTALLIILTLCCSFSYGQYILNGSAQKNSCNCYTLTQPAQFQSGSVWNSNKINLNNAFDFWFNVFLGCNDNGADGIVFILQPISTSVGSSGEGMGFGGVLPSIGIALDTYSNPNQNDPIYDHISIQANGITNHANDLAGPVPISTTSNNVEDCQWHKLRITWDPTTKWLRTYFDGILRVERQVDLIPTIFNNDPMVYWGFTGATGGQVNLQQFCTALDPIFQSNFTNNAGCEGVPIAFTNNSESFAPITNYNWDFGDGNTSTQQNPPPHLYSRPGEYKVTLKIRGQDGCERDTFRMIRVGSSPAVSLQVFDTCSKMPPRVITQSPANATGITYQWQLDGTSTSGTQPPNLSQLADGLHQLQVTATSDFGCGQPVSSQANFSILPLPAIQVDADDGCVNETISLNGLQTDPATTVLQWNWLIGERTSLTGQNVQTSFEQAGTYPVKLWAVGDNGCASDTVTGEVKVVKASLVANDTTVMQNLPAQLNVIANGSVQWSPAVGLNDPTSASPIATLPSDQEYTVSVITPEGCTTEKDIRVKVFKGPTIYVPSAFTPNGDGKNEILLPVYVGIKQLKQFAVFNRWGQKVFSTNNTGKGWNGNSLPGTYVWVVEAVNYLGQSMQLKGTVTLIR